LGYTLSGQRVTLSKEKLAAIKDFPMPTLPKTVREFLGLANYFRSLIPRFSQTADPLNKMTRASTVWRTGAPPPPEAQAAFNKRLVGRGQEEDVSVPPADKLERRVLQQKHEEVHQGHDGYASAHGLGGLVALNDAFLQLSRAQGHRRQTVLPHICTRSKTALFQHPKTKDVLSQQLHVGHVQNLQSSSQGGKGKLGGTARQARGLLRQEDEIQNVRAGGPGHHLLPNPPPGISAKFHIFWKTFTVIEMVGKVNVKASQHNKKPIVVHIDRVLNFNASGSGKEKTENIHCIRIDLEAEREWARLDRERALGQQEDEEEEEAEFQWHIRRRTAGATQTLSLPSSSATRQPLFGPRTQTPPPSLSPTPTESDRQLLSTPPPSSSSGTRQPLPPRVKKKKKKRRAAAKGKRPAKGKQPAEAAAQAEREQGAAALLRRAARAAKAAKAAEMAEGPDTHWLDAWTNMGVAIYGRNNQLLVPGREQKLVPEEDPTAAKPMLEQTEPTTQPTTKTRSSRSAGPPEKQPWTFGCAYWPSRK
jgi:hypothetical protein